jgi:hypothetical protein
VGSGKWKVESGKMKAAIAYKSRAVGESSEDHVPLSRCLLSSSLMKALKVKPGYALTLQNNDGDYFLLKCWSCRQGQLLSDTVFVNRSWNPSFDGEEKFMISTLGIMLVLESLFFTVVFIAASRLRIQDCKSLCLIVVNENTISNYNLFALNSVHMLGLLQDVYCRKGLRFSLPSNGVYITYEVHIFWFDPYFLIFPQVIEAIGHPSGDEIVDPGVLFCRVYPSTHIVIQHNPRSSAIIKQDNPFSNFHSSFAGYLREKELLLKTVGSGLSMADSNPDDRYTKAAMIVGSPGTGKTKLIENMVSVLGCNSVKIDFNLLLSRWVCVALSFVVIFLFKQH